MSMSKSLKRKILQKSLHKSDTPNQFQKLFKSVLWYCFNIKLIKFFSSIIIIIIFFFAVLSFYTKHTFMLSILFKSHLIRHSGTRRAFKDTQTTLEHLRHLESTRALRHSDSTERALRHSEDTWALGGHSEGTWALGHLRHLGTRTLRALKAPGTQAFGHLRYFI